MRTHTFKFIAMTLSIAVLALSGCNLLGGNPLLGKWTVVKLTAAPGAAVGVSEAAALLTVRAHGEVYNFEPNDMKITNQNGGTILLKVLKYKVENGGHKVIVVQKQEKEGMTMIEHQPAIIHDGGQRMDLTSGEVVIHCKKD